MLRRAVVLGGGGVTGVPWEVGLLLGLAEAGADLGAADLLVGTSAGSVVAAQVASGVPLEEMFARQVESASGEIGAWRSSCQTWRRTFSRAAVPRATTWNGS
jgi:NTE family protein